MISKAALSCLKRMVQAETRGKWDEAQLVCEGDTISLGQYRVPAPAVKELLQHIAIVKSYEGGLIQRYTINDVGRAIHYNPKLSEDIIAVVRQRGGFTIEDGKVARLLKVRNSIPHEQHEGD